ncbi:MAG: endo-1,4-beta-xylanase [Candidatus Sumerlaeota bacterium]|nr:endo-1,4-beta-xylanase [Candidatus Sumerlaeota bacterium]
MKTMAISIHIILLLWLACEPLNARTIEADKARIKTVGGMQDGAWNLWSIGEWGDYVETISPGAYRLAVEAKGSPAAGQWPIMAVVVDGESVDRTEVQTPALKVFAFSLNLKAGHHRVTVQFMNDLLANGEDRNLYVKRMTLESEDGAGGVAMGDEAAWRAAWTKEQARQEQETLEQAASSIEKCRKEDASFIVKDLEGRPIPGASVKIEQTGHEFLFGGNIYMFDRFGSPSENDEYKERFAALFNYATVGFYWRAYEPQRGKPDYPYTDRVVAWCRERGIRMKGHPLLWAEESGIPAWSKGQPSPEIQRKRVSDILHRYQEQIEFWEVVNEPAHLPDLPIDDAYRWAREADPGGHLIVNDYQVMADGFPPFFDLLKGAIARKVPFDGIGIQAHEPNTMRFPLASVHRTLDHYAELGKKLHITEFTPTSGGEPVIGSPVEGVWDETTQADYAAKFYTVCFSHPAVAAITWWDLCDRGSWLKGGGLLRKDLTPKPAYAALMKLIHDDWTTRAAGQTDENGCFPFRGFRGRYSVDVEADGKRAKREYSLAKNESNRIEVTLK